MEGDVITLQDIFLFDFGMGVDETGRFRGVRPFQLVRPWRWVLLFEAGSRS